jgi:cystathionine gamma-synthase
MSAASIPYDTPALGKAIPASRHACVSCFPTFEDVCGYETQDPRVLGVMETGYPRFFTHPLILQCQQLAQQEIARPGEELVLMTSPRLLEQVGAAEGRPSGIRYESWEGATALMYPTSESASRWIRLFLQHTGCRISSRWAEDILLRRGLLAQAQEEILLPTVEEGRNAVMSACEGMFPEIPASHIFLSNCGMSAFFSAFCLLRKAAQRKGKRRWLQLGWLYLDTMEILKKFLSSDDELVVLPRPGNTQQILQLLEQHPEEWAGVITEFPTNPLLECCDLIEISNWCRSHKTPLVVDPTLVTGWNVQLFPYADIVVSSFTKYAGGDGDVMGGVIAVSPDYADATSLIEGLPDLLESPYPRDLRRLGEQIGRMRELVRKTGETNAWLVERLRAHPGVKEVFFVESGDTAHLYQKVKRPGGGPGGMTTVVFHHPKPVHDALRMAKGPSFGLKFSLCCPFMYLAYYSMVTSEEGRAELRAAGLDPELIRFSFGLEEKEELWSRLQEALQHGHV